MTARPHANFSQFWPQTTMATLRNQLNSLVEQVGLGPRYETLAEVSGGSGTEVLAVCLPFACLLSAHCLLGGTRNHSCSQ